MPFGYTVKSEFMRRYFKGNVPFKKLRCYDFLNVISFCMNKSKDFNVLLARSEGEISVLKFVSWIIFTVVLLLLFLNLFT